MTSIDMKKLAGYALIFGPLIALTSYFIQPGGVLGIGGTADPTVSEEVMKILSENSALGIISGMTVIIGLLTILSGYVYLANSMEGGNGYAVSKLGLSILSFGVFGFCVGSSMGVGISSGIITDNVVPDIFFAVSQGAGMAFGLGGMLIWLGLSSRDEYNKNLSFAVVIASAVVFITPFITAFAPENARLINSITGVCFFIITLASINIGRVLTK